MKKISLILFPLILFIGGWWLFSLPKNEINYASHIDPILRTHCVKCHHPGGPGPFSLNNYKEASRRSKMMAVVTQTRFMPPWPADPTYTHFTDENFLTDEQIKMLSDWADAGAPSGDTSKLEPHPVFHQGSLLGQPDLVLRNNRSYLVKGNNKDHFLLMKFPYEMEKDTFIRAIEFVPDTQYLVHHMNGFLLHYEEEKKKNVFEGEYWADAENTNYSEAYEVMKIAQDDGTYPLLTPSVCNYLPGVLPTLYPEGIGGFQMKRTGSILLKDIHYGPQPVDRYDHSYFNIFFAPKPPVRRTLELQMGTFGVSPIEPPLVIPPDTVMTFLTRHRVQNKMTILTINPHMHLLGKTFLAFALTPGNDTIPLIRIPKWDFRWQYFYTFNHPVILPAGSVIYVYGTFDNTRNNVRNPFHPPRTVSEREGSMRTTDEMFQFIITYLPYKNGDEEIDLRKAGIGR